MELVFITEARFIKDGSGSVYSIDGTFSVALWERYLTSFSRVHVMARVKGPPGTEQMLRDDEMNSDTMNSDEDMNAELSESRRADSPRVSFIELPYYIGLKEFLKNYMRIKKTISANITEGRAYICRCPGILGSLASAEMRKRGIPYGAEIVGDPYEVFAPGAVKSNFSPWLRSVMTSQLKTVALNAASVLYVTRHALQRRYPARPAAFTTTASNVVLPEGDILPAPKGFKKKDEYNIISIGSLEQMYKAPDVVLKAIEMLKKEGIKCRLTWIGEGRYRQEMIRLSRELEIEDRVTFTGSVEAGEGVRRYLDAADIFVLASRTEGLPRAMIEAMGRGLPCIGSDAGGIPELLDEAAVIPKDDAEALAGKVKFLIDNPDEAMRQAERNLSEVRSYASELLDMNRRNFYEAVKTNVQKSKMPCRNKRFALSYPLPLQQRHF